MKVKAGLCGAQPPTPWRTLPQALKDGEERETVEGGGREAG